MGSMGKSPKLAHLPRSRESNCQMQVLVLVVVQMVVEEPVVLVNVLGLMLECSMMVCDC